MNESDVIGPALKVMAALLDVGDAVRRRGVESAEGTSFERQLGWALNGATKVVSTLLAADWEVDWPTALAKQGRAALDPVVDAWAARRRAARGGPAATPTPARARSSARRHARHPGNLRRRHWRQWRAVPGVPADIQVWAHALTNPRLRSEQERGHGACTSAAQEDSEVRGTAGRPHPEADDGGH